MARGLDRVFLHYGVRQEDMDIIEQSCRDCDIDPEWLKEYVLMPCNKARFLQQKSKGKGGTKLDKLCMGEALRLWAGWNEEM